MAELQDELKRQTFAPETEKIAEESKNTIRHLEGTESKIRAIRVKLRQWDLASISAVHMKAECNISLAPTFGEVQDSM